MLRRVNLFWLAAGAVIFVFGANELAAFVLTRVPRWLGGTYSAFSGVIAMLVGALVAMLLGIRPPVDESPPGVLDAATDAPDDAPPSDPRG
jgi:ABC-type antimicrobial peptide transport system permease subunit